MLRSVLFRDFKGADTLLVWGDNGDMLELRAGLYSIFEGRSISVRIEGGLGLSGLTLQATRGDGYSVISGAESDVSWLCSPDVLENVLQSVEPLTTASEGHQYIDARGSLASRVLISVNEYPESFRR